MQGWGAIPPPLPYIMAGTTATNANITPFNAMAVAPAVKTQVVITPFPGGHRRREGGRRRGTIPGIIGDIGGGIGDWR